VLAPILMQLSCSLQQRSVKCGVTWQRPPTDERLPYHRSMLRGLAMLAVLAPGIAMAQPSTVPAQPRYVTPPPYQVADETWYGWKIALSDGAAVGAFYLADTLDDPSDDEDAGVDVGPTLLALGALAWWTFGTPLVHALEKNFRGAGVSIALRWTAPLLGALIGSAFDPEGSPDDPGATAGIVIGVATASLLDITLIANRREVRTVRPQPQLAVSSNGFRVGLVGAF
jgi:hypothetical protein